MEPGLVLMNESFVKFFRTYRLLAPAGVIFFLFHISMPPLVYADPPTINTVVGDVVTDPLTNEDATVTGLIQDANGTTYAVTTDANRRIYTSTSVDDTFPGDADGDWSITDTTTNAWGYVDTITMERQVPDPDDPNSTITQTQTFDVAVDFDTSNPVDANGNPIDPAGSPGTDENTVTDPPATATGDYGDIYLIRQGSSGADGRDGYGVRVCVPHTDICTTVSYSPKPGKNGSIPSSLVITVPSSSYHLADHNPIETVSRKLAGITALGIGGNGGQGGDAYGNIPAEHGGRAGNGGRVTVTTETTISTTGYRGHGVFAQSRAGEAGDGGDGWIWSQGGSGGGSAHGGTVRVTNRDNGIIGTTGNRAHGIVAQSLGGSSGSGGDSWGLVGKGGSSDVAGDGGNVYVTNDGRITTGGTASDGIFAQSVGGTGGDGGSGGGILGEGGSGSLGGDGGSVSVTTGNSSQIETSGTGAHGIFAQSIGGGGGNGGVGAGIVGLGSDSANGGDGAEVTITADGEIVTHGQGSFGILAQSIGGGGGNAGVGAGIVGLGGSGSGGGEGGDVSVSSSNAQSSITTWGDKSHGIVAQSIGGGGGTGGLGAGAVAIGGKGGSGGDAGSVTVHLNTSVATHGEYARPVFVQSIGGGGGAGSGAGGAISIGGSGSGGGDGGGIHAYNDGAVFSSGIYSDGLFIQSIGGGGGSGGGSGGLVSIGGSGDGGGRGGQIDMANNGAITTQGGFSRGIFVQSIGGGGGSGGGSGGAVSIGGHGSSGGYGGGLNITNSGTINTFGLGSDGFFVQSVGGGGGNGAGSGGVVSLGGDAGRASHGGDIVADNSGSITTWQNDATAMFIQSIGGGGGRGSGSGGVVSLGGTGGGGGNGGMVNVINSSEVLQTAGDRAYGIFAQSVGGGGGSGGGSGGAVSLGGDGSSGGNGGAVTVAGNGGSISTSGNYSDAIFAQSVGGGGGSGAGSGGAVSLGGDGSGGGSANNVHVTNSSVLNTFGDHAEGIFAQSVGGGGGSGAGSGGAVSLGGGGDAGGSADQVEVTNHGNITTRGISAEGIFVQSIGGGGGDGAGSGGVVSLGGSSAAAGDGEKVIVGNSGNITTLQDGSDAIFAQSVGGGGGEAESVPDAGGSGGAVSLGGDAGGGGNGGDVEVSNSDAVLQTHGANARGIFAQSVGGGGGNGAGSGGLVSLGGDGGVGGAGGNVTVNNVQTDVTTLGGNSDAVFAQSVGGGGGVGAGSGGGVSLGGGGATGGTAGNVMVNSTGVLITEGRSSRGIFAQSVGGGGGNGAGSGGLVSIGGHGGGAGNAGSVTVVQGDGVTAGGISTAGAMSDAVFAQSIGGGGGNGAGSGGVISIGGSGSGAAIGGNVTVTNYDTLLTDGLASRGIFAQSIGGGGGNGAAGGGLIALGGSGSGAGDSGNVTVVNSGYIHTGGTSLSSPLHLSSTAIFAQSVGGGGGSGGTAGSTFFTMGGHGAGGGNAGIVNVTSSNDLMTISDDSDGIFAQSLGGGGGKAGSAASGSAFAGVAIGSSGGSGGDGDSVSVTVRKYTVGSQEIASVISTAGNRSRGIVAQSVGGGGGNGGSAVQGTLGTFGALSVAVGGSGGDGGDGGNVTVNADTLITTLGENSHGFIAQSVGGGGGNGGYVVSGTIQANPIAGGALSIGVGGSGGDGGSADAVIANLTGGITTHGDQSGGLLAQSVGGGGGIGGFNVTSAVSAGGVGSGAVSVGVGGSGGGGGDGSTVSSTVVGNIATEGWDADALIAQSIGGGGGSGGFTIASAVSGAGSGSGAISVGVGGSGGNGGDGAAVTLDLTGDVTTVGNKSGGVLAQSVGGGGGNGGFNISSAVSGAGVGSGAISVGVGGSGAIGGDGGTVNGSVTGNIVTHGVDSDGAVFQSVGGGGGNGGFNISGAVSGAGTGSGTITVGVGGAGAGGGVSSAVVADLIGDVATRGNKSEGVLVQSIGGGGGNGGFDIDGSISGAGIGSGGVAVGVGGAGGSGGGASTVNASVTGYVGTHGKEAGAVIVQSVGGGGGNGGFDIDGAISGAGTGSGAVTVGIGGSGGDGGNGAAVRAQLAGEKKTEGKDSVAVLVQSLGGGGGNGGFNITDSISGAGVGSGAVAVGIGGTGGGGGDSSTVNADIQGDMETTGTRSGGAIVQSIGGGGGNGGFDIDDTISGAGTGSGAVTVGIGGSGGNGGNADDVTASIQSNIITHGSSSDAVLVQSLGGGGGNGGFNITDSISGAGSGSGAVSVGIGGSGGGGGNGAAVTADVSGAFATQNHDSRGVVVQSVGGGGGNGGLSIAGSVSLAGTGSGAVSVGIGGAGGNGGNAGSVSATADADLYTMGNDSTAFLVQSVGGGGGNGGIDVSGSVSLSKINGGSVGLGVGGFGGEGGNAGDVNATLRGLVQTFGNDAQGALVQSLGGGGGNGGVNVSGAVNAVGSGVGASVAVGLGGFGGGGGNAGVSIFDRQGNTRTVDDGAVGVASQSIGGGGGNGGINISGSANLSLQSGGAAVAVGLGGFGGDGGQADNARTTVNGLVVTGDVDAGTGRDAIGVLAQSVGGGGGNGGTNIAGDLNVALNGTSAAVGVGVGGFGGGGGNSAGADVNVSGDVATFGPDGHGVVGQSIGGGGGNGGINVTGSAAIANSGQAYSAAIGVGGFGGGGGNSGDVDVQVSGNVLASGLGEDKTTTIPDMVINGVTMPLTGYDFRTMTDGSHGIVAQSLGGGGGNGGINISGGLSIANPTVGRTGSLVTGVGGFGGSGGNAGDVTATVNSDWVTAVGDERSGVLAQSIGGGGGNGGLNVSGGVVMDGPLLAGVGGFGGDGGVAGNVFVDAHTNIQAQGESGTGILAQSLGGGGGNGGINISGSLAVNKKGTLPSVTFGVGGFGGSGNISNDVTVDQAGTITTNGKSGHGLLAQSIAGGGGNGGLNIATSINHSTAGAAAKQSNISFLVGIGGHAGDGADAGDVQIVRSSGDISTRGDYARGILAQSLGGGGGTGGLNVSTVVTDQGTPVVVGIGGFGEGGGNAGSVSVNRGTSDESAGLISTDGKSAIGLESTSIGGGGGDAGMNFLLSYAGGGGGSGGTGTSGSNPWRGKVDDSVIANFDKVIAELKGNQGGSTAASNPYSVQLAIGGAGGHAGHGNTVIVNDYSTISTHGFQSHGLLAQSIGGGGGNATFNVGLGYTPNAKAAKIALGGATGDGGNGGQVTVDHHGDITTTGKDAVGVLAQSIGGGGGNAGLDFVYTKTSAGSVALSIGRKGGTGGRGGAVELVSEGIITTQERSAYGLFAQSIGNGGGNSSAYSAGITGAETESGEQGAAVAIGIEGGLGGEGGDVTLTGEGVVTTHGDWAHALFAQSIGGGGGNGGQATAAALTAPTLGIAVGGSGGQGAVGGTVTVNNGARVGTFGEKSVAILAQSIGGGGGTGGAAYSGGAKISGSGIQVTVGGSGGTGAAGGRVSVTNTGTVVTDQQRSHGILAQSIGGGGGSGGLVINTLRNGGTDYAGRLFLSIGGDGGTGGIGQQVEVDNSGAVITTGKEAIGIFAQSIGGGGGSGSTVVTNSLSSASGGATLALGIGGTGGTGGTSGDVVVRNLVDDTVENSGLIETEGDGAHGVFALSIGGGGGTGSTVITSTESIQFGSSAPSSALTLSIGGDGGVGGAAGTVTAENGGHIITHGIGAHGIVAESIGGGGGNGGMTIAGNAAIGSRRTGINSAIAIGGNGGSGNTGNNVVVTNSGTIETYGDKAYGIFAQSVGGGGGNSGTSVAASIDPTKVSGLVQSSLLSIGIGGSGGDGATAGDVVVTHNGTIITNGADTYGIYAQSVGGGGGTSSLSYSSPFWMAADLVIPALLGSRDSISGIGGDVTVNSTGTIITNGANSNAVFTQAISSGGGNLNMFLDISKDAGDLRQEVVDVDEVTSITEDITAFFKGLIGLGGDGNQHNSGGAVTSNHTGDILATGENASGLIVQSVGGGGGTGVVDLQARQEDDVNLQLVLGATNSDMVTGGQVTVHRSGHVVVLGDQGTGVSVQSIGGGGGILTASVTRSTDGDTAANGTTSVTMGSSGGTGHDADNITLDMQGDIYTAGDRGQGILAQSIGAGGGDLRLSHAGQTSVLLGGQQGATGNGGRLLLQNSGLISTQGDQAHALFLQSIGGGGGALFSDLNPSQINLTLSNNGAGNGGAISLDQEGDLLTGGMNAYAAFVQSIGGGGGAIDDIFAGSSGGIGNGGDLTLSLSGTIMTAGDGSRGVFAQSEGGIGSGGDIDAAVSGLIRTQGRDADAIRVVSVGGTGAGDIRVSSGDILTFGDSSPGIYTVGKGGTGAGGRMLVQTDGDIWTRGADSQGIYLSSFGLGGAGDLTVTSTGGIHTMGDNSTGIFARSDGGNNSGAAVTVSIADSVTTMGNKADGIYAESIGVSSASAVQVDTAGITTLGNDSPALFAGSDGGTGLGMDVSVTTDGDIVTGGADSTGIFAQSIGLQGSACVHVHRDGNVITLGDHSMGIVAQSIGGSGGNFEVSLPLSTRNPLFKSSPMTVYLGGSSGLQQNGGDIDLALTGNVSTGGDYASALFVQSIGGGGGILQLSGPGSVDVFLGGQSGVSGNGGNLRVVNNGSISTSGTMSHGIFLQSIGGGGGAAFSDQTVSGVRIFPETGGAGNGGDITLVQNGSVVIRGTAAYGAFVQSIGGGGGAVNTMYIGSSGGVGNSGNINATFNSDVITTGKDSVGIFLQSAAGTGMSGDIDLQVNGNVLAGGRRATAIHAESLGGLGSGDINITLNGGLVSGGLGGGIGVEIVGGHNNLLSNHAVITTGDGIHGMAISGTTGNDMVDNYGTVIGNVDLGSGRNGFYNRPGAWMISGPLLNVGSGNEMINSGHFSPGGTGNLMTTNLIGNFIQTSGGTYYADLDFHDNRSDQISVSGSAKIDGTVKLITHHPEDLMPGLHTVKIITAGGGVTKTGAILSVRPSAVVDYQLTFGSRSLAIGLDIDFSPFGLSFNQGAIGEYFNALQLAGGRDSMDPYIRYLFMLTSEQELADTYGALVPDFYDNFTQTALRGIQQSIQPISLRMNNIFAADSSSTTLPWAKSFSLDKPIRLAYNGSNAGLAQLLGSGYQPDKRYGTWINVTGFKGDQDPDGAYGGYDYRSKGVVGGLDYRWTDSWVVGMALGHTWADVDVDEQGTGDIDSTYVSLYSGYFSDTYYLDGILSYGHHGYDTSRQFMAFAMPEQTISSYQGHSWSAYWEGGYTITWTNWALQPFAGLQYAHLAESPFVSTGADALDLVMQKRDTDSLISDLGIRLGGKFITPIGSVVPEMSVSWNHDFDIDEEYLHASFAGFQDATFTIQCRPEKNDMLKLGIGLTFQGSSGFSSSVKYIYGRRNDYHEQGIVGELRVEF